jgi:hypothetical protein
LNVFAAVVVEEKKLNKYISLFNSYPNYGEKVRGKKKQVFIVNIFA